MGTLTVTTAEFNTILAALRFYEYGLRAGIAGEVLDIATNCQTVQPLTADEVADLCEKINFLE